MPDNTCSSVCNVGFYLNITDNKCYSCSSTCKTCSGPSSSQCLTCYDNLFIKNNTCVNYCGVGYFANS